MKAVFSKEAVGTQISQNGGIFVAWNFHLMCSDKLRAGSYFCLDHRVAFFDTGLLETICT